MDSHRLPDLLLLYQLVSRVKGGVEKLCGAWSGYIKVINIAGTNGGEK